MFLMTRRKNIGNLTFRILQQATLFAANSVLLYLAGVFFVIGALFLTTAFGQTSHKVGQGVPQANQAPGSPLGSYALSGFESVNPFSGKVNFSLRLLKIGGRGSAGYPINLNIQRNWFIHHQVDDPNIYSSSSAERYVITNTYTPSDFDGSPTIETGNLTAGLMKGRHMGANFNIRVCGDQPCYDETLTRLTFTQPDGTEIEFRDVLHGGRPIRHYDGTLQISRGTHWYSADGSAATFIASATIYDKRQKDPAVGEPFYPSGTLYLANGTKYAVVDGRVTAITDVNGNRVMPGVDSLGREVTTTTTGGTGGVPRLITLNFNGIEGAARTIKIQYASLESRLSDGFDLNSLGGLFPITGHTGGALTTTYNPEVASSVELPNGSKYQFRYNNYGELTEVTLPTGGQIEYVWQSQPGIYGTPEDQQAIPSMSAPPPDDKPNMKVYRRVEKRRVYEAGVLQTETVYSAPEELPNQKSVVTVDNYANESGGLVLKSRTKHYYSGSPLPPYNGQLIVPATSEQNYLYGKELKTEVFDSSGTNLLRRTLQKWHQTPPAWFTGDPEQAPMNDPRLAGTVSVIIENNQALATLGKTEYDEDGSSDPAYFSHLNVKKSKGYHYKALDINTAKTDDYDTIAAMFGDGDLASISETDYLYSADYKARGILSLPTETRSMNPANPTEALSKSQVIYDEQSQYYSMIDEGSTAGYEAPTGTYAHLRGNPTTTKTWVKDTNTWLTAHAQYDNFGNLRKAWDISGDQNRFAETVYEHTTEKPYYFAFPTKVIAPAPDPSNTHGTNQTSTVETFYDFDTGLVTSVKDEFGQVVKTEYDNMLRPTRVFADNFTSPETQTIYGAPDQNGQLPAGERFVKVRKQIDASNWDEAVTWFDGLGRTIKTQAKDSQGDVFVETEYDEIGRVKRTSNPYRAGDIKYWSKPRYDEAGRVVETYAPAQDGQTGASLGITSFSISTVSGFVGTVVTTTDASGRKGRSITNALGQLLRVDEPTGTTADLGDISDPNQPTYYTYDVYGKMVKVQQGKTGDAAIQYRYFKHDSLGRLIRVKQPEQEVNSNLNLTDSYNTTGQWTAGFTYDIFGNVLTATDAKGVIVTNTYDKANRVKTRTYSDGTPQVSYFYDGKGLASQQSPNYAKGKLTKVSSSVSETRYTQFDNLGRLTNSQQITDGQTYTSSYQYNLSGALVQQTYPSGRTVSNEFESDGDLMRVFGKANANAQQQTYANSFSYTAAGGISQMKLGNGRWESAKFNERLQLTELGLGASSTDAGTWKVNYEYGEIDANGNLIATKNTGNIARQTISFAGLTNPFVQTYKYDAVYRLTEAKETSNNQQNWIQNFGYDRFGNRTSLSQNIGGIINTQTPSVNADSNRFNTGQGFGYDKNGNITQDVKDSQTRNFIFNGDNKQTEIRNGTTLLSQYFYDGEGKRVKKKVYNPDGVSVREETVFVYDGTGKLIAEYSTEPLPETPQIKYLTEDHLGTPRVITDNVGNVIARRDFMPFGEELFVNVGARAESLKYGTSADDVRQKFTGYQKDAETELDFAEARMYENRHGRFTAVDPLLASGKSANPQTFNRFVYVGNNPIVRIDPTGKDWIMTTKANGNGLYIFTDVYGTELEKMLASGKYERVKFDGDYRDESVIRSGEKVGIYRMYEKGGGEMVRNFVEEEKKEEQAEIERNSGGLNSRAMAFAKGYNSNYDRNMWLVTKMAQVNLMIIGGLGGGLGGSSLTTLNIARTSISSPLTKTPWFFRGAENDLAWSQLSWKDRFLYEFGTNTVKDSTFAQYANLSALERGRIFLSNPSQAFSWRGMFLGAGRTFGTGPTPAVRWGANAVYNPATRAGFSFGLVEYVSRNNCYYFCSNSNSNQQR